MDPLDYQGRKEPRARQDLPDSMDREVSRDFPACLDLRVHLEDLGNQVNLEETEFLALKETQVFQAW